MAEANAPILGAVPVEHLWAIRERLVQAEPASSTASAPCAGACCSMPWKKPATAKQARNWPKVSKCSCMPGIRWRSSPKCNRPWRSCANHYTLGVVTNGNADVRRLGLADYFKFALCAEDIGIAKPDARFWRRYAVANRKPARRCTGDHPAMTSPAPRAACGLVQPTG
jgi:putative hydrolase of the HAD superfamily